MINKRLRAELKAEFLYTAHVVPDRTVVRDQVALTRRRS